MPKCGPGTSSGPSITRARRRTVLLEHRLPDGSSHVDWLLAIKSPSSPESRCVKTWRLARRVDDLRTGERLDVVRLPDHRALYLHHEGRVTPGAAVDRGTVRRLAVGSAIVEHDGGGSLQLRIDWRDGDAGGAIRTMRLLIEGEPAKKVVPKAADSGFAEERAATVTRIDGPAEEAHDRIPKEST